MIAEAASAEALGVDGTPTLFINGQPIVGALDPDGWLDGSSTRTSARHDRAVAHGSRSAMSTRS